MSQACWSTVLLVNQMVCCVFKKQIILIFGETLLYNTHQSLVFSLVSYPKLLYLPTVKFASACLIQLLNFLAQHRGPKSNLTPQKTDERKIVVNMRSSALDISHLNDYHSFVRSSKNLDLLAQPNSHCCSFLFTH